MKRTHTQQPPRYGHHERASVAVRIARFVRELTKAIRLQALSLQETRADEDFSYAASLHELSIARMNLIQRRRVKLAAKRMQIERGLV
ncbi:hypothetical protein IP92_04911 [Pseudoduganella flava]|uniref:DUF465 domain-containing protein n=1 Tax=Pseudoduganella flava TaxID=871742 RepID=A0A562PIN2_9BURK|nr:hypothetical protein [Pseudoduganella flava]QGZ42690.1 hypothetical protein GO485_29095 [Pseudoduganella flava]TWI43856.1 hypothetical protein IP92_04911 [Pseudoduganella flava]